MKKVETFNSRVSTRKRSRYYEPSHHPVVYDHIRRETFQVLWKILFTLPKTDRFPFLRTEIPVPLPPNQGKKPRIQIHLSVFPELEGVWTSRPMRLLRSFGLDL